MRSIQREEEGGGEKNCELGFAKSEKNRRVGQLVGEPFQMAPPSTMVEGEEVEKVRSSLISWLSGQRV